MVSLSAYAIPKAFSQNACPVAGVFCGARSRGDKSGRRIFGIARWVRVVTSAQLFNEAI